MHTTLRASAVLAALIAPLPEARAVAPPPAKKIVLLVGRKSHGPLGNGIHDYPWSARLIKVMLESSNVARRVRVEFHEGGWPRDPSTLDDAAAVFVISDGRDGHLFEEAPHLASPERVRHMAALMRRGCGFGTFHFSTFAPDRYAREMFAWSGGYFDWEENGKRQWYSAIRTAKAEVRVASPNHPVARGLKPFTMNEEFYYDIRFDPKDEKLVPLWEVPSLGGRKERGNVVAWARERDGGGRGFGTTCGHFYDNWKEPQFRKMVLNALVWSAGAEVPEAGVEAAFFTHDEIRRKLGEEKPLRVLLLTGNDAHKWHNWEMTTPAIKQALEKDRRIVVDVSRDPEDLAKRNLSDYGAIVQNYCNWHDPKGLSEAGRRALTKYLGDGGGLVVVHFANGAFHRSLPKAGASDWPEYRKIVRRVWDHEGKGEEASGHDAFGAFTVEPTKAKHPVTDGLKAFAVTDELYFRQAGKEPVEPLLTARSKVTRRDEPLAFAYAYGKGRVFQVLLGHSERTYEAFAMREVMRRATAWAAGRETRPMTDDGQSPKRERGGPTAKRRRGEEEASRG